MRILLLIYVFNYHYEAKKFITSSKIEDIDNEDSIPVNVDHYIPIHNNGKILEVKPSIGIESHALTEDQHSNLHSSHKNVHYADSNKKDSKSKTNKPKNSDKFDSKEFLEDVYKHMKSDEEKIKSHSVKEEVFNNLKNKPKVAPKFTDDFVKKTFSNDRFYDFGSNVGNKVFDDKFDLHIDISKDDYPEDYEKVLDDIEKSENKISQVKNVETIDLSRDYPKIDGGWRRFSLGGFPTFSWPSIPKFNIFGDDSDNHGVKGNRVAIMIYRFGHKDPKMDEKRQEPRLVENKDEKEEKSTLNSIIENYNFDDYKVYTNVLLLVIGVLMMISGVKLCVLLFKDRRRSQFAYQIDETQLIFDDDAEKKDKKLNKS